MKIPFKLTAMLLKRAGGFPRLMRIMKGQVPTVHTIGILSVDNPQNKPLPPAENNRRRDSFTELLKRGHYGYIQHGGVYNNTEHSFLVMNVSKRTLVNYWGGPAKTKAIVNGREEMVPPGWDQESVIFGTVDSNRKRVVFELIEHGQTTATREVVLHVQDGADNFYSFYKGRKFQIPFFDAAYAPDAEETNLPANAPLQEAELTRHEANLTHLAQIAAYDEQIRRTATGETVDGYNAWAHRGQTMLALNKLKVGE